MKIKILLSIIAAFAASVCFAAPAANGAKVTLEPGKAYRVVL